ncbi:hypothetical protein [Paenibacillus pinistramenti]|uniref:hypothetical protein n=1 Tax=Paenibacillus pinistramenti TaxID=1768003 RepID=UPI001396995F|nr:hypothetical protein [Paenibacillus pinistramenti]
MKEDFTFKRICLSVLSFVFLLSILLTGPAANSLADTGVTLDVSILENKPDRGGDINPNEFKKAEITFSKVDINSEGIKQRTLYQNLLESNLSEVSNL